MADRRGLTPTARVLIAIALTMTIAFSILTVIAYIVTTSRLEASLDSVLVQEADAFAAAMSGAPREDALLDATRAYLAERTGGASGLDTQLVVSLETSSGTRVVSNRETRLEQAPGNTALKGGAALPAFDTFSYGGVRYRSYAVPIVSRGMKVGVFQAALTSNLAAQTGTRVALSLLAAGLASLAVGLPLAYLSTRRALAPLTRMAEDAERVTWREPGQRIAYEGPDQGELAVLAEALNDMLDRLERAYEDQRRFVADASHELRTPLAVIRGNAELLMQAERRPDAPQTAERQPEEKTAAETRLEELRMIEAETVRMSRLLDELLALARLESTGRRKFQPVSVATLVEEVEVRARRLGEREIVRTGECTLWIEGDPDQLDQAMANLLRNAIAQTPPDGRIEIGCAEDAGEAIITVADNGPGIPAENLPRIFDRFYRAERTMDEDSGSGLGLAITQRLVQLHGGTITAENVEPHGARFTIRIPATTAPNDATSERT